MLGLALLASCTVRPDVRVADEGATPVSYASGKQLLEQGKAAGAVSAFRRMLRQSGPDLQVLNGLAIAYAELGRADLAADTFARALDLAPQDPATLNNIGFAALRRADTRLARHYLERAQAGADDLAEINGNLMGLGFLETLEHQRPSTPSVVQAALAPSDRPLAAVALPPSPALDQKRRTKAPEPPRKSMPTPTMIDFTDVIDPFSHRRNTGMPRP